jgi:hypothetical protein
VAGAEAPGLDLPPDVLDDLGAGGGVADLHVGPTCLFLADETL